MSDHSDLCWLNDTQLLLLSVLLASEKWSKTGFGLKHLIFDMLSPLLLNASIRFNRIECVNNPLFYGRIASVEFHEQCIFDIWVDSDCHDELIPLVYLVKEWQHQLNPCINTIHWFRDASVMILDNHQSDMQSNVGEWYSFRDLVPQSIRQGTATSVYLWLCHLIPKESLRLETEQQMIEFMVKHFRQTSSLKEYSVSKDQIHSTIQKTWSKCHQSTTNKSDGYLFCCCNWNSKQSCHKIWCVEAIQLLYFSQLSHGAQSGSSTIRPPDVDIPHSNWMDIIDERQLKTLMPPMGVRKKNKKSNIDIESVQESDDDAQCKYEEDMKEYQRLRETNFLREYDEVECLPTSLEHRRLLRDLPVLSSAQQLEMYLGTSFEQVKEYIISVKLEWIHINVEDQCLISNALTNPRNKGLTNIIVFV